LALGTLAIGLGLGVLVWAGWRHAWFLTDDAYIAFRYVDNARAGRGLVWNPAPFLPVEGYTSFSWVMCLWGVWAWLGVAPPAAANVLSLLCGYATLIVVWRMLRAVELPQALAPVRGWLTVIALVSVATHRVFLTWLSSGLETALFVFSVTWWVAIAFERQPLGALRLMRWSLAATLMALTRPDGLLAVAATGAAAVLRPRHVLGAWPLLLVLAHLLWRRSFYGEWLPNTYYAKYVAAWPDAGWRYLASYGVENGVWAWLLLAGGWCLAKARHGATSRSPGAGPRAAGSGFGDVLLPRSAAFTVLLAHTVYYTLVIGGDHFEYRVLAHLPALMTVAATAMAGWTFRRPVLAATALAGVGGAALPLAWLEWCHGTPLAAHVPRVLRPLVGPFDEWQAWLHSRCIGIRRAELRHMLEWYESQLGTREEGSRIGWRDRPVIAFGNIGVLGWVLPNVAIIDEHGLTDWVVARNPVTRPFGLSPLATEVFERLDTDHDGRFDDAEQRQAARDLATPDVTEEAIVEGFRRLDVNRDGAVTKADIGWLRRGLDYRQMAHERYPPAGYIEGFEPNVRCEQGRFFVEPRSEPLTDEEIVAHEAAFRAQVARAAR